MNIHPKPPVIDWRKINVSQKRELIFQYCINGSSAAQCVTALNQVGVYNMTRNAMIGFIHRNLVGQWNLGSQTAPRVSFKRPNKPIKSHDSGLAHRIAAKQKIAPRTRKSKLVPINTGNKTHLMETTNYQCRYPLWDDDATPEQYFCCGAKKTRGEYCEHHANICLVGYYNSGKRKAA